MEFRDNEVVLCSKSAMAKFEGFRQNSKFCDVSLQSGDAVVKAHRAVLAAVSPYLEAIFNENLDESNEGLVNIPSIPQDLLPILVDFIYTGKTTIAPSSAQQLMVTAHMLGLGGLVTGCAHSLKTQLNTSNVLDMLSFAETLCCTKLTEYTLTYIGEHWTIIAQGKELLKLPLDMLIKILSSNQFAVDHELQVVYAVVRWLEHSPHERVPHCADLVRHLRLGRVPEHVLAEMWRVVRDTEVAESLRAASEKMAAKKDARVRGRSFLYVVDNSDNGDIGAVYKYDIYENDWSTQPEMSTRRSDPGVAAAKGRLYVVGGQDNNIPLASGEAYDPITKTWSSIANMIDARSHFGLVALKGKLYAFGGRGVHGELSSIEVYDVEADRWTRAGSLPRPMSTMSAVIYNEAVYILHEQSLLRYEPSARAQGEWRTCAEMSRVRRSYSAAVLDDYLYVVGGTNGHGNSTSAVERYNFATNEWTFTMPRNKTVEVCVAGAVGGVLYVAGEGDLEMYNVEQEEWIEGTNMPQELCVTGCAVLW